MQTLFLHIPKTAGTSFNAVIESHFNKEEIIPVYHTHEAAVVDKEAFNRYNLVRGHFPFSIVERFYARPAIITLFRDPAERSLSNLRHIRNSGTHWLSRHYDLKKCSLDDLIRKPLVKRWLRDFQTKMIGWNFSLENCAKALILQVPSRINKDCLDEARRRLRLIDVIGFTERPEESLRLMCHYFQWEVPAMPRKNVTENKEGISPRSERLLRELTSSDYYLYEEALNLFEKRRRGTAPSPERAPSPPALPV